ncbi:hypothetical protein JN11_00333 [Mucilaginibacter frigoritolerans]|uniref:Glycosyl transferase family 11 n=1 Tax=Mucilaginibacter frigoritolerans TaxID=652788 RepID=A0A562UFL4_9SPHI|nr:hypothetical protein [Mucilaginibacter frigoritolerans]TWJ04616.1 hypothetical protein JN11_00333 [Mucilaginibacter frigoritolerans]
MRADNHKASLALSPNYGKEAIVGKIKRRLNSIFVNKIANTSFQFKIYKSYWHYRLMAKSKNEKDETVKKTQYITLRPNYGAGIGHQLANWNSGLYFSKYFGLNYAHSPFSTEKWEYFLGFGENEVHAHELKKKHYRIVQLPRFDSENQDEIDLIDRIINSYDKENVLFCLEIDQGYMRQFDTYKSLSDKFFGAEARKNDKLIYDSDCLNIAVHIRRRMKIETEDAWKSRGLDNQYFANVLSTVVENIGQNKKVALYLFSQGEVEDFPEFDKFKDINYCMQMGPVDSFLHMVFADVLISSKSSFSYKPVLISKGIKICPGSFWHQYPSADDFIISDDNGDFDINQLRSSLQV